jgi:DNA polymerase III subunit delta'
MGRTFFADDQGRLPLPWLEAPLAAAVGHRGHALLLHGGLGRGLFELAMTLAQTHLCSGTASTPIRLAPCGRCDDCHLVRTQVHPDLHVLLPEALRLDVGWRTDGDVDRGDSATKPSRDIRVQDMRTAIDWSTSTASRDHGKVLVVHPASRMNAVTANALLKTLEEPSGQLKLVLTAHSPAALMPTLSSRCQHIHVDAPGVDTAVAWLQGQGVDGAAVLLAAAGGEPLEALDMAQRGLDAASWSALPQRVMRGEAAALSGWSVPDTVDALTKLCHDAMSVAAGAAPRYFPQVKTVTASASWERLRTWSIELVQARRHAEHPWHAALAVESLVLRARWALAPA